MYALAYFAYTIKALLKYIIWLHTGLKSHSLTPEKESLRNKKIPILDQFWTT